MRSSAVAGHLRTRSRIADLQGTKPADLVTAARAVGVRDARLLKAIGAVPRADFVPRDLAPLAYNDSPLPIPHRQVTTQPSLVAPTSSVTRSGGT